MNLNDKLTDVDLGEWLSDADRELGLWYLASTYSKYPLGLHSAFVRVASLAANLVRQGYEVFSPIAHTHPIAIYGGMDPLDHSIWLAQGDAIIPGCCGIIVAKMDGWQDSKGIKHELARFREMAKPVRWIKG